VGRTYVEVGAETAIDAGTEVDEAIVGGDDAFYHLPVYVCEHHVLVGQARCQPVVCADGHESIQVQQLRHYHPHPAYRRRVTRLPVRC